MYICTDVQMYSPSPLLHAGGLKRSASKQLRDQTTHLSPSTVFTTSTDSYIFGLSESFRTLTYPLNPPIMALNFIASFIPKTPLFNKTPHTKHAPTSTQMCTHLTPNARSRSSTTLGVVITGSTKGVGRALAEQFLKHNDRVVISSRTPDLVDATVASLRARYPTAHVFGCVADVCNYADVAQLTDFATKKLGGIDTFICNAGTTGARGPLRDAEPDDLRNTIQTNLLGPMYCAKYAQHVCQRQQVPLHLFIMDGSGTRGNSTENFAAYGATKRSVPQLISSLSKEAKNRSVRFHQLSPGMVLTDLLLCGSSEPRVRRIFNFLAEEPETVAEDLVPRIRSAVLSDKSNTYIAFLTIPKAIFRLATGFLLGMRNRKFFDPVTGLRIDRTGRYNQNGVRVKE